MNKFDIEVQSPARICFYGDHQDYLNLPIIAGAIDKYINIKAKLNPNSNKYNIKLLDIKEKEDNNVVIDLINLAKEFENIQLEDYFRAGMIILQQDKDIQAEYKQGYDIQISGNIPINAGISSSSALCVCWIRFLLKIQERIINKNININVNDIRIGHLAYQTEVQYFNQPGGLMDHYTIAQKGLIFLNTKTAITTQLPTQIFKDKGCLILAESGISKETLEVLKNAKSYALKAIEEVTNNNNSFDIHQATKNDYITYLSCVSTIYQPYWYAAIHNHLITQKARQLLSPKEKKEEGEEEEEEEEEVILKKLGELMNEHQKILQECIQNTPPLMTTQMEAALDAGALGTKIVGSGGGGCMIALVWKDEGVKGKVIQAFKDAGCRDAYEVNII